ncbi:MAG: RNB domain-containing ribonuclease, partial [Bdellovibrionales bacterium]
MTDTPDKQALLRFIADSPTPLTKRQIVQAFDIKGDDRRDIKGALRELMEEGSIVKLPGQEYAVPRGLPSVAVVEVYEVDIDGDVFAKPSEWNTDIQGEAPKIEIAPDHKKGHASLKEGDRALCALRRFSDKLYEGKVIKKLDDPRGQVMGLLVRHKNYYALEPTNKRVKHSFDVPQADLNGASDGDLVVGEIQPARGLQRKKVRIVDVIGRRDDPRAISLIALYEAGLSEKFPQAVIDETEGMSVPDLKGREDLRQYPLVTIDGADARDFDDAVFAEKTEDGYHLIVAIADVAYYVRP